MRKVLLPIAVLIILILISSNQCFTKSAIAETLGPPHFIGNTSEGFEVYSPKSMTYQANSVLVNFTVILSDTIYDVGYSLDNRSIQRITTQLVKISDEPLPPDSPLPPVCRLITFSGTFELKDLSDGNHSVTLYQGYQFTSGEVRFDIMAWTRVDFSIDTVVPTLTPTITTSPTPTITTSPTSNQTLASDHWVNPTFLTAIAIVITIVVVASLALVYFKKHKPNNELDKKL